MNDPTLALDTLNQFAVTAKDSKVLILGLVRVPRYLTVDEALQLAAWLIVGAELAGADHSLEVAAATVEAIRASVSYPRRNNPTPPGYGRAFATGRAGRALEAQRCHERQMQRRRRRARAADRLLRMRGRSRLRCWCGALLAVAVLAASALAFRIWGAAVSELEPRKLVPCNICGAALGALCLPPELDCGCATCAAIVRSAKAGTSFCGGGDRELAGMAYEDDQSLDPVELAAGVARLKREMMQS